GCGGALVGLLEASLITATSGPAEEYWLFPYAVASYGVAGALIGVGVAATRAVAGRLGGDTFSAAAALACFGLGLAVARYHIIQRVFHEELVMQSAIGAAVHFGLFVAVGVVAVVVMSAGRLLQRHRREIG